MRHAQDGGTAPTATAASGHGSAGAGHAHGATGTRAPGGPPCTYCPRDAEHTVLHQIVREHLTTFLRAAAERTGGDGLPAFIEHEFRDFMACGVWARGFARFRCDTCHAERLVPFSCKGRICPSCAGRRMAERAAHLVDHVLPAVPIRQWVLTLPHRLRYQLAWDHTLCRAVLAVYARALLGFERRRACRRGVADGKTGAVTAIQRFGSGLNCNLHFHTLVLDGVYTADTAGTLRFDPAPPPTDREVARLVATIARRIERLLRRRGLAPDDDTATAADPLTEDAPALAELSRASVMGRSVLGRRPGAPVLRLGRDPDAPWVTSSGPRHAHLQGFDLHANRTVRAHDRIGVEKLCQYLLRPPLGQERLEILPDGQICCTLARPWSDGTQALLFTPIEFLEKLASLIPRPHINLLIYHGALASHARARPHIIAQVVPLEPAPPTVHDAAAPVSAVPVTTAPAAAVPTTAAPAAPAASRDAPSPPVDTGDSLAAERGDSRRRHWLWAELLRRVFQIDILACTACGGRLRFIATIEDPPVVQRILAHVGLPTALPEASPARPPPAAGDTLAFDFPG